MWSQYKKLKTMEKNLPTVLHGSYILGGQIPLAPKNNSEKFTIRKSDSNQDWKIRNRM